MPSHRHFIDHPSLLVAAEAVLVAAVLVAAPSRAGDDKQAGAAGFTGLKKAIAVVEFEDKSDHTHWAWSGPNPGTGMTDMLTTALVKSGKFRVIEREQLHHVLAEQNLGTSGAVTPQTAAKVGKILGVSAIVYGAVTEFGYKKEESGGTISRVPLGAGYKKAEARVGCDVRIVDTSTAEILAAENFAEGESKRGLSIDTDKFSFGHDSKFDDTLVGKATRKVIDKVVGKLTETTQSTPWVGRVVKSEGEQVFLNAGTDTGVTTGMSFVVYRKGEDLVDPETGQALGSEESQIGTIEVVSVKEKFSIAKAVSGSGMKAGDIVRSH